MISGVLPLLEETKREPDLFCGGFNAYSTLLAHYAHGMAWLGNFEEGKSLFEKSLRFSLEIDDVCSLSLIHCLYGFLFFLKGEGGDTVEHLQRSLRYSEEGQVFIFLGLAWSSLGAGYYLLGELETARNYMERGLKTQIDIGRESLLSQHYVFLSMVHFDSGDFKSAQNCIEKALGSSQKNNERQWEGVSKTWLGRILGKADSSQRDKAEENILEGIQLLKELKLRPFISQGYCFLGELYAHFSQTEKALENLKKAEGMFLEMGMDYWLARTKEVLNRL